jgi:hypothetical protein
MPLAPNNVNDALPGFEEALAWSTQWPSRITEFMLQAQQAQLQAWLGWQESLTVVQRELWDLWACRWAGGAPIDA